MQRTIVLAAAMAWLVALAAPAGAKGPDRAHDHRTLATLVALAEKGSARAQFELAERYEFGRGVVRDTRAALALYCLAATQNHATAAYRAGEMLMAGHGARADHDLGGAWLARAAWLGHVAATRYVPAPDAEPDAPEACAPPGAGWRDAVWQGRIWRGPVAPPAEIRALVARLAPTYGLDPKLVLAVIAVESGFRTDAVSPKQAMGLMQLIPDTAARFGVADPFDPEQNLRGGMKYLRWLLAAFEGRLDLALAGYNAGEGAVLDHAGVPPYQETRAYVTRVRGLYGRSRHPFDPTVARAFRLRPKVEEVAELGLEDQPKSASIED